jgi:thiol:disulfide interchange protein
MQDLPKICPNCGAKDVTSFSKCRFCNTRYDAKIEKKTSNIDSKYILIAIFIVAFIGAAKWGELKLKEEHAKQMAPITNAIKEAKRPRMLEFYASWCGPCHQYEPTIEACRLKYQTRLDVVRYDIDKPENKAMVRALSVSAIPRTFLFDSNGNQVDDLLGGQDTQVLEEHIQEMLAKEK